MQIKLVDGEIRLTVRCRLTDAEPGKTATFEERSLAITEEDAAQMLAPTREKNVLRYNADAKRKRIDQLKAELRRLEESL